MKRFLKIAGVVIVVLLLVAVAWAYSVTKRGLAQLDGEARLPGLSAAVTVERDDLGVPRINADNVIDAGRALGFLHGQERFFQMDLLRRRAAGELSELFGEVAVNADTAVRMHRLRVRARATVEAMRRDDREELDAYVEGVNAGVNLAGLPFEYTLLRKKPAPWLAEDSILAIHAMYLNLQDDEAWLDRNRGVIRDAFPAAVVEFLLPAGSQWDAPLIGEPFETPPIPGSEAWDVRGAGASSRADSARFLDTAVVLGSNNWVVSGEVSADGRAWVANDMHLALGLPHIWYRASMHWTDEQGEARWAGGVTLPGLASVVAGSTGRIAWGFTNTQGDWSDLVELEFVPGSDTRYLTPDGEATIETFEETIEVKGGLPRTITVEETIWGPILDGTEGGPRHAVRWIGHDTGSADPGFARLRDARSLEEAFGFAHAAGMPCQNIVVASSDGRLGWTIAGPIPDRVGHDGRFPESWADGTKGWRGRLAPEEVPQILDPPSGLLWTANNRTMDGEALRKIGDGGYVVGARAKQIRDGLRALAAPTASDLLQLQLDDRALFLQPWKDLLETVVSEQTSGRTPRWDELQRQLGSTWTGRASVDSVAYRMVRRWRHHVSRRVFEPLMAPCREIDEEFSYRPVARFEGPLWRILDERPAHLLAPEYESWDELLATAVDDTLDDYLKEPGDTLDAFTWGDRNTVVMAHPLSGSLPGFLGRRLNIAAEQLPGDAWMPRVQSTRWGASERFVVSPGHQDAGLLHMPGGQSGHPFSPYYRNGHRAWAEGAPTPFLSGETRHTLVLTPRSD